MTSAVRYKEVVNTTGVPLTVAAIPPGDGIDRLSRVIKRLWATADIGTNLGQVRHAGGAIIGTLGPNDNVLSFQGLTYRPAGGIYQLIDNSSIEDGEGAWDGVIELDYFINDADKTVRLHDDASDPLEYLAQGDITIMTLIIGNPV